MRLFEMDEQKRLDHYKSSIWNCSSTWGAIHRHMYDPVPIVKKFDNIELKFENPIFKIPIKRCIYNCSSLSLPIVEQFYLCKFDNEYIIHNIVQITICLYKIGYPLVFELYYETCKWLIPICIERIECEKIIGGTLNSLIKIENNPNRKMIQPLLREMKKVKVLRKATKNDF